MFIHIRICFVRGEQAKEGGAGALSGVQHQQEQDVLLDRNLSKREQ